MALIARPRRALAAVFYAVWQPVPTVVFVYVWLPLRAFCAIVRVSQQRCVAE
jgi:hypothetical protein